MFLTLIVTIPYRFRFLNCHNAGRRRRIRRDQRLGSVPEVDVLPALRTYLDSRGCSHQSLLDWLQHEVQVCLVSNVMCYSFTQHLGYFVRKDRNPDVWNFFDA